MWRQRAKSFWLVDGDKNSKLFHSRATQRTRSNRIHGITNSSGRWVQNQDEVADSFIEFYQELFDSSNPVLGVEDLDPLPCIVSDDMNSKLSQEFMDWKVQAALKQMAPLKAPGSNGMPPLFYQNYWELVGDDVTKTILSYLNSASLPHPLNHTFLTLIPKIKNPITVSDFRPISLCNVLYKIFSKVLANHLKKILPNIISEQQSEGKSGFVSHTKLTAEATFMDLFHS